MRIGIPSQSPPLPLRPSGISLTPRLQLLRLIGQRSQGQMETGIVAKYTPDFKASGATETVVADTDDEKMVTWAGGDIEVTVTTNKTATPHRVEYSVWTGPKCLRVAFTYEDDVDRTFQQIDPDPNDVVNQILEGAFVGSERSVKRLDLNNKKPEFQGILDGIEGGPNGITVLTYTVEKAEDASGTGLAFSDTTEVLTAVDVADVAVDEEDEDDRAANDLGLGDDRLTYSLSGADAKYFVIVGSVDHPTSYDYDPDGAGGNAPIVIAMEQGQLSFKVGTKLEFDRPDDKRVYRVTITARDPSGDKGSSSVVVIVNITDVNERPELDNPQEGRHQGKVRGERHGPRVLRRERGGRLQSHEPRNA